jgi:hypothetical protein
MTPTSTLLKVVDLAEELQREAALAATGIAFTRRDRGVVPLESQRHVASVHELVAELGAALA